jgi:hypothetical protein
VEGTFSSRETAVTALARFTAGEAGGGALAGVGEATETLADISMRLNAYMTLLPKVARWQAALGAEDVTGRENLRDTLDDVQALAAAARRADRMLADLPGTIHDVSGPVEELLNGQRDALLAAVRAERIELTGFVTAERRAALAAVDEERRAATASIAEERATVMKMLEGLTQRSIEDATGRARGMVNLFFWRALLLLAAGALFFGLAFRFARAPRPVRE